MTDDAVFMGTDEWERWPKIPDFAEYVARRFEGGTGWIYKSVERKIMLSDSDNIACYNDTGKSFPMLQKFLQLGQMKDLPEAGSVEARASVIGELVLTL